MYVREHREKTLTLVVSGKLWNRSLVMLDRETESLWSHLLGKAMDGKLKGAVLETLPSTMVDWKTWKADHPDTTVLALSRTSPHFRKEFHGDAGRFVLGLRSPAKAKSYGFDTLTKIPVINDIFDGEPVVIVFRPESAGGRAYRRNSDGKTLSFEPVRSDPSRMKDAGTGSIWSLETGLCESGSLEGRRLTEIPAIVSFRKAWQVFYPESERFDSDRR